MARALRQGRGRVQRGDHYGATAAAALALPPDPRHLPQMPFLPVTEDELRRAVTTPPDPLGNGDHDLNPHLPLGGVALRPAAVLAPVVRRPDGLTMLLTLRPTTMRSHAGQVAFPGGKVDPTDASPLAAALREAEEEIGLAPAQVEVLGRIERYVTGTGYEVTPFVGLVAGDFAPTPEPGEVEAVFETPLDFLMDFANHRRHSRDAGGVVRRFWGMTWGERFIWGATAGMLRALARRVEAARASGGAATPIAASGR